MTQLTCTATRRLLQPFHDGELAVGDQIAVSAHVEWCDHCAGELEDLRGVATVLQSLVPERLALTHEEAAVFNATVVNRLKVENDASFLAHLHEMFDDMHFVYAGFGAAAATVMCVVIMLSMMRFATDGRPDSLAALVGVMATPLECESGNDLADASGCRARWAERFQRANESAEQDTVFALESVVTRQGRVANLETLRAIRHRAAVGQVELIEGLLDAVSRSRLDAGQALGAPEPSNMLWLVQHATVRANKAPVALDVPLPPKKRAAAINSRVRTARA
jgi:hypothetical protein